MTAQYDNLAARRYQPEGRLIKQFPLPPGFEGPSSIVWESVTPYVPPRHHLRAGKECEGESIVDQIRRELVRRGIEQHVDVDLVGSPEWVSVHVPRREARKRGFIGDRRAQMVRLRFSASATYEPDAAGVPRLVCTMALPEGVSADIPPPAEKRVAIGGEIK